jgi:hypothetical protein
MGRWLKSIHGFRSGSKQNRTITIATYLVAALCTLGGLWSVGVAVLVAAVLLAILRGLRAKLPALQSPNRLAAVIGYSVQSLWVSWFSRSILQRSRRQSSGQCRPRLRIA